MNRASSHYVGYSAQRKHFLKGKRLLSDIVSVCVCLTYQSELTVWLTSEVYIQYTCKGNGVCGVFVLRMRTFFAHMLWASVALRADSGCSSQTMSLFSLPQSSKWSQDCHRKLYYHKIDYREQWIPAKDKGV